MFAEMPEYGGLPITTVNRCCRLISFTACASCASAGIANSKLLREVVRRLQRVGEVDPRALVAAEAIAGLVELEADLQVRDGVGRHQQLVAVQARQQVLRHVLVPERVDLLLAVALRLPLGDERLVDDVDDLDEEGAGAGGGVEDLDEGLVG